MLENGVIPITKSTTTTTKKATSTTKRPVEQTTQTGAPTTSAPQEAQTTQERDVVVNATIATTPIRGAGPAILFSCNFEVSNASPTSSTDCKNGKHPAGTSENSDKCNTIKSSNFAFIMVVYEHFLLF